MLKTISILAIPGTLASVGLLYGHDGGPTPRSLYDRSFAIEVGIAFDEAVVRAALPDGLEPSPVFTGGIAVYGGEEGWALSPLSTGYVWLDVIEAGGTPARYLLKGFTSELDEEVVAGAEESARSEIQQFSKDGVLHVEVWPDLVSNLEIVVKPAEASCTNGLAAASNLLRDGPGGSLGVVHMPTALEWCAVEAEAGWVSVTAPFGHVLRPFVPQQVLWAQVATPL